MRTPAKLFYGISTLTFARWISLHWDARLDFCLCWLYISFWLLLRKVWHLHAPQRITYSWKALARCYAAILYTAVESVDYRCEKKSYRNIHEHFRRVHSHDDSHLCKHMANGMRKLIVKFNVFLYKTLLVKNSENLTGDILQPHICVKLYILLTENVYLINHGHSKKKILLKRRNVRHIMHLCIRHVYAL